MDGLSAAEVDELFREADHDGDGRLAGNEAKAFFQRTSLPVQALSKVQPSPRSSHPLAHLSDSCIPAGALISLRKSRG